MRTLRERHLTPNVNILGYGAGGIGLTAKQDAIRVSRWKFAGHLDTSKGSIWYDTLKWTLEENELESQPLHSNVLHTAFAFEHNANEFYMTVEVKGKLIGFSDRLKNKIMRFGPAGGEGKSRDTVTTKFQWTDGYSCPKRLDKMAEGLEYAMEYENLYEIPLEMPDTLPAQFRPMTEPRDPVSRSFYHSEEKYSEGTRPGILEVPGVSQGINEGPTLDDLARAAGFAPSSDSASAQRPPDTYQASEFSSPTLIGSGREDSLVHDFEATPKQRAAESEPESYGDDGKSDAGMLIWLTQMPLIAVVLKLLAAVMGLKATRVSKVATTDTHSEEEGGSTENARLGSYNSSAGSVSTTATGPPSSVLNGTSYVRRRKNDSLPSGLEMIEEVNPEVALGDKVQGDPSISGT
ncbi:hypothetical protein VMCG_05586 [Cytospora schulzeri]|uniref:Uncharacterized protein n=1 Tax=Cytospora schulzeri TaxID=448051 RepID=A0A423WEM3_9PEZI|nr:hypothetical protein VMCG_05586 [Valsa malicola]